MKKSVLFILLFKTFTGYTQYAPGSGMLGSTAIRSTDPAFKAWASTCTVIRGWQDISDHSLGKASVGDESAALGAAGLNGVISLGDGGSAVLGFDQVLSDGPGPDFAVFENAFNDSFLELAFVEVSSDGTHFTRFPATSLSQDSLQYGNDAEMDPTKINNLAGKYRALSGTPFDLAELSTAAGLDITHITHVRIIDVVGSLQNAYATFDHEGHKINDPWPTPFASSGFDLDAVGLIDQQLMALKNAETSDYLDVFPNPANDKINIRLHNTYFGNNVVSIDVKDSQGSTITSLEVNDTVAFQLSLHDFVPGIYFLYISDGSKSFIRKIYKY